MSWDNYVNPWLEESVSFVDSYRKISCIQWLPCDRCKGMVAPAKDNIKGNLVLCYNCQQILQAGLK